MRFMILRRVRAAVIVAVVAEAVDQEAVFLADIPQWRSAEGVDGGGVEVGGHKRLQGFRQPFMFSVVAHQRQRHAAEIIVGDGARGGLIGTARAPARGCGHTGCGTAWSC